MEQSHAATDALIMTSRTRDDGGFTLVELLVVMAILAVLAGISIPAFAGQRGRAHGTAAKSDLRNAAAAAESYFAEHSSYPATWVAGAEPATPAANTAYYAKSPDVSLIAAVLFSGTYCLQVTAQSGEVFSWSPTNGGLQAAGTHCPGL